jgi:hypothetical protein
MITIPCCPIELEDIDILTMSDGLGSFDILFDSNGNVLIGDFL